MPLAKFDPTAKVTAVQDQAAPAVEAAKVEVAVSQPKYTGRKLQTDDDKMSKADWANKDRRIGRAGLYQAALQSTGLMQYAPTLEDYFAIVRKAAEEGLKFVHEEA